MENVLGLEVVTGNSASLGEADDRWEIAEAKNPVRRWLELCERDEVARTMAVALGKGDRGQIWKRISKYLLSAFPTTSDLSYPLRGPSVHIFSQQPCDRFRMDLITLHSALKLSGGFLLLSRLKSDSLAQSPRPRRV